MIVFLTGIYPVVRGHRNSKTRQYETMETRRLELFESLKVRDLQEILRSVGDRRLGSKPVLQQRILALLDGPLM